MMRVSVSVAVILALAAVSWETVAASTGEGTALDLAELSLEELLEVEIEITSVAKKPQTLSEAAAAIYVLTGDDIRRSGVRLLTRWQRTSSDGADLPLQIRHDLAGREHLGVTDACIACGPIEEFGSLIIGKNLIHDQQAELLGFPGDDTA